MLACVRGGVEQASLKFTIKIQTNGRDVNVVFESDTGRRFWHGAMINSHRYMAASSVSLSLSVILYCHIVLSFLLLGGILLMSLVG